MMSRCARVFRSCFPIGFKEEVREMFHLAWPTASVQLLWYMSLTVSFAFCGHLGKEALDGAAIATMSINVFASATLSGLSTACDTLFSQVFGTKNKKQVGVILQRSILIVLLCCLPMSSLFVNTEPILLMLGQDPEVSRLAGIYTKYYLFGLPAQALHHPIEYYLNSQSIVRPSVIIGIIGNVVNVLLHFLLLFVFPLGISGASLAMSFATWSIVGLHIIYILVWQVYKDTWAGLSWDCLQDWGQFFGLAVPGMAMTCLEWWAFETMTFMAGWIGEDELAAYIIADNFIAYAFMILYGIAMAVTVRVGNHLGGGRPDHAKISSKVAVVIAAGSCLVIVIVCSALRSVFSLIFTDDRRVQELTYTILGPASLLIFLEGIRISLDGTIRGTGLQKYGALVNFIMYCGLSIPISYFLMFNTTLSIGGVYWGFIASSVVGIAFFVVRLMKLNWKNESIKAQLRAGLTHQETVGAEEDEDTEEVCLYARHAADGELEEVELVSMGSDDELQESAHVPLLPAEESHTLVATDVKRSIMSEKRESVSSSTKLSVRQLIIRRGLLVAACVLTFLAGLTLPYYCRGVCFPDWTSNTTATITKFSNWTDETQSSTPTVKLYM